MRHILVRILESLFEWRRELRDIRITPYPPSFSKIAANTIDPAIGASTWAFGSHRCTENIGSFTKKPLIINRENIRFVFDGGIRVIVDRLKEWEELVIKINIISIGREASTV